MRKKQEACAQLDTRCRELDPPKIWHQVVVQAIPRSLLLHESFDANMIGLNIVGHFAGATDESHIRKKSRKRPPNNAHGELCVGMS